MSALLLAVLLAAAPETDSNALVISAAGAPGLPAEPSACCVKTHTARLFDKLSARRRTQAVQHAKEAGLIP